MNTMDKFQSAAWRFIYDHAPLLFLRLDEQGRAIDANRFTREHIAGEWQGKTIRDIFLFPDNASDLDALRSRPDSAHLLSVATRSGLPETFRVRFLAIDGETLVSGSPDADETMRLRREMISLNNRLNTLTRELQKKNHELEELNRLKNQFLGMAAHDLRKPVGAILSYTEFLMDETGGLLNEEQAGFLKTIHGSTDLMRRVIDDFLDIAMIESGRFDVHPAPTDMRVPVTASIGLNRVIAQKKGVMLSLDSDGALPPLSIDAVKIEQVLNNLIANAIEHSPTDSTVRIRIFVADREMTVRVEDTGPGIPVEEQELLFKPFVRGGAVKSAGSKSTGLGLAISRKIVEAHGGRIWIEDNSGKGAVFAFCVPLNREGQKKMMNAE